MPNWGEILSVVPMLLATTVIAFAAWKTMRATERIAELTKGTLDLYELEKQKGTAAQRLLQADLVRVIAALHKVILRLEIAKGIEDSDVASLRRLAAEGRVTFAKAALSGPAIVPYLQSVLMVLESAVDIAPVVVVAPGAAPQTGLIATLSNMLRVACGGLVAAFEDLGADSEMLGKMGPILECYSEEAAAARLSTTGRRESVVREEDGGRLSPPVSPEATEGT